MATSQEDPGRERILELLRPYAANWSGSLGRGDLVIPRREIPRLIGDLIAAIGADAREGREASDTELFQALRDAQRSPSLQEQAERLRAAFVILRR